MSLKVTVLGSGTSHGVPMIGCECAVCQSTDPRDRRTRPSILLELDGVPADASGSATATSVRSILVDTSTDLRFQALAQRVARVVFHRHEGLGIDGLAAERSDYIARSLRATVGHVFGASRICSDTDRNFELGDRSYCVDDRGSA